MPAKVLYGSLAGRVQLLYLSICRAYRLKLGRAAFLFGRKLHWRQYECYEFPFE